MEEEWDSVLAPGGPFRDASPTAEVSQGECMRLDSPKKQRAHLLERIRSTGSRKYRFGLKNRKNKYNLFRRVLSPISAFPSCLCG